VALRLSADCMLLLNVFRHLSTAADARSVYAIAKFFATFKKIRVQGATVNCAIPTDTMSNAGSSLLRIYIYITYVSVGRFVHSLAAACDISRRTQSPDVSSSQALALPLPTNADTVDYCCFTLTFLTRSLYRYNQ